MPELDQPSLLILDNASIHRKAVMLRTTVSLQDLVETAGHQVLFLALHNGKINCPNCQSTHVSKNGHRGAKQNYLCVECGRQFIDSYSPKGYPDTVKEHCLKLYVNGLGFRAIERCTGVNHNTV